MRNVDLLRVLRRWGLGHSLEPPTEDTPSPSHVINMCKTSQSQVVHVSDLCLSDAMTRALKLWTIVRRRGQAHGDVRVDTGGRGARRDGCGRRRCVPWRQKAVLRITPPGGESRLTPSESIVLSQRSHPVRTTIFLHSSCQETRAGGVGSRLRERALDGKGEGRVTAEMGRRDGGGR